jgi:hypothetical protein
MQPCLAPAASALSGFPELGPDPIHALQTLQVQAQWQEAFSLYKDYLALYGKEAEQQSQHDAASVIKLWAPSQ